MEIQRAKGGETVEHVLLDSARASCMWQSADELTSDR